jgi:hypothetical protein
MLKMNKTTVLVIFDSENETYSSIACKNFSELGNTIKLLDDEKYEIVTIESFVGVMDYKEFINELVQQNKPKDMEYGA